MQMPADKTQVGAWILGKLEDRKKAFLGRNAMMDFDRRLLLQAYRQQVRGVASITSAEPRNAVRLGLDIMTRRDVRFHALVHDQEASEVDRINDIERLFVGIWRSIDRRWRQMGNRAILRDLDWYILMGGYALNPIALRENSGVSFIARVLDPKDVYPEYDDRGCSWVPHVYKAKVKELKPRFANKSGWDLKNLELKADSDDVEVVNCFWLYQTESCPPRLF